MTHNEIDLLTWGRQTDVIVAKFLGHSQGYNCRHYTSDVAIAIRAINKFDYRIINTANGKARIKAVSIYVDGKEYLASDSILEMAICKSLLHMLLDTQI